MTVMYFVWLGSGRAKKRHVALEGQLLDQAAKAGLPVAPGAILLDEFYRVCLKERLVEIYNGCHIIPDAELLHATLFYSARLPRFERPVVASLVSTGHEMTSTTTESPPLIIDASQPDELARALATVWNIADHTRDDARRDVLLVEEIVAEHSGRACIGDSERGDRVERHHSDTGERSFTLPVLSGWKKPDEERPPYAQRLQMLLRGIRRTFGRDEWAIEWVDDGHICHLRRIMPLKPPVSQS